MENVKEGLKLVSHIGGGGGGGVEALLESETFAVVLSFGLLILDQNI